MISCISPQPDTRRNCKTRYGASALHGMPVYSQLSLVLINRPRGDGTLSLTFGVTWRHRSCDHSTRHVPFPIGGPLELSSISNGFRDIQWRMRQCDAIVWHDLKRPLCKKSKSLIGTQQLWVRFEPATSWSQVPALYTTQPIGTSCLRRKQNKTQAVNIEDSKIQRVRNTEESYPWPMTHDLTRPDTNFWPIDRRHLQYVWQCVYLHRETMRRSSLGSRKSWVRWHRWPCSCIRSVRWRVSHWTSTANQRPPVDQSYTTGCHQPGHGRSDTKPDEP